jgi:hypothetical protein
MMDDEMQSAGKRMGGSSKRTGYTITTNCYDDDGTYDVVRGPLQPIDESAYPDGLFRLESIEEALKAVLSLKQQGGDYQEAEDDAMMGAYGGAADAAGGADTSA